MSRGFTRVELLVVIVVLLVGATLLMPALLKTRHREDTSRCGSNLKNVALASLQYVQERGGAFPHIAGLKQLDGDHTSTTAAQCIRTLTFYNYLDNPDCYTCPASPDQSTPLSKEAQADTRLFAWGGKRNQHGSSPLYEGKNETDLPLEKMTDLSLLRVDAPRLHGGHRLDGAACRRQGTSSRRGAARGARRQHGREPQALDAGRARRRTHDLAQARE
jgi:type II secretory pathway pseudopilin PulG